MIRLQIGRRLLARLLRRTAILTAVLLFLALLLMLRRVLGSDRLAQNPDAWQELVVELLRTTEVAVAVAAQCGSVLVLLELKRSGVLLPCLAAGLSPRRLLRVVSGFALLVALLATLLGQAAHALGTGAATTPRVTRAGDRLFWEPTPGSRPARGALEFDAGTLHTRWLGQLPQTREASPSTALCGKAVLDPPPLVALAAGTPIAVRLSALLRAFQPVVGILLLAGLVLAVPLHLGAWAIAVTLAFLPLHWGLVAWLRIRLWQGGGEAWCNLVGYCAAVLAALWSVARSLDRRGFRR